MPQKIPLHYRLPVIRHIAPRLHLAAAAVVGGIFYLSGLVEQQPAVTRALIAWDIGIALYIVLSVAMMRCADTKEMEDRAKLLDEGRIFTLLLAVVAVATCLAAICVELADAKEMADGAKQFHTALVGGTVVLSWLFLHIIYALHYAHEYYSAEKGEKRGGLDFPGKHVPLYWDFAYFSFVIGMTAQTADISITGRAMRKIALGHCILSFFFNIVVLALTVNTAASLF